MENINTVMYFAKYIKMEFIKEEDNYFQVKEQEVEATIYVRNESGDVEEVTGFNLEYDREQVTEDIVLNYYHNEVNCMNSLYDSIEEVEKKLEELESSYQSKKKNVDSLENILPSELHATSSEDEEDEEEEEENE